MTQHKGVPDWGDMDDATDERIDATIRSRLEAFVPDTVKKLALAGMGAVFMTEEGIRNAVADLKLPREVVSHLLSQTEKARSDLFRMIAEEVRQFLEHANIAGEVRKVLTGVSVDVHATIRFQPSEDEEGLGAKIASKVGVKKGQGGKSKKKTGG